MDEAYAIHRLQAGDMAGLEYLVRSYQVQAVRAAYLIVRDSALAQDVVQSAFIRASDRIRQFDANRPFGPWFLKSVVNDSLKLASRRQREVHLANELPGQRDPTPGPERAWERAETAEEVWTALGRLTAAQRAAIVQRYYLELSHEEMAAESGCPPSTVKARLHAARERLRSLLRPAAHDLEITP
jgi:RNA polymerase sigma-70 factor, ECF subfamily